MPERFGDFRVVHTRFSRCQSASAQCWKKRDQAIGRSKGGLTTKIHTRTDALGNPTGFYLAGDAAHDLCGSDELLDFSISHTWLTDRAYDVDSRVIAPIKAVQGNAVIMRLHALTK